MFLLAGSTRLHEKNRTKFNRVLNSLVQHSWTNSDTYLLLNYETAASAVVVNQAVSSTARAGAFIGLARKIRWV